MNSNRWKIDRRRLIQAGGALAASRAIPAGAQTPPAPSDKSIVWEKSVPDITAGYQSGEFSIPEFIEASIDRVNALDGPDTYLSAMLEINPDAVAEAERLDQELRDGRSRGPMHGIPMVIKDVFATADNMQTTAGSPAMSGTYASRDAFIVERMREAGIIILGKANLTEFSGYRPVGYGWSGLGGLTVNPYVTSQTTWGSSSGSAAAVAASYVPVSIGVETDGSIICPAAACGVVGIKPTMSLTSREGAIGNGYSLDSPGVIGRSVADAAALLTVISGADPNDVAFGQYAELFPAGRDWADTVPQPGVRNYERAIVEGGLQGARIGVVRAYFGGDVEADRHAEEALKALEYAGAELVEDIYPLDGLWARDDPFAAGTTMGIEFPAIWGRWLSDYAPNATVANIEELVAWYEDHWDSSRWEFEMDPFYQAQWPLPEWGPEHMDAIRTLTTASRQQGIDAVMDQYSLDALVCPTCSIASNVNNTQYFWSSSELASDAGYPSVTIVSGYTENLPAGLHFFGKAFTERKLIRYAAELERILQVRIAPEFLEWTNFDDWYLGSSPDEDEQENL